MNWVVQAVMATIFLFVAVFVGSSALAVIAMLSGH